MDGLYYALNPGAIFRQLFPKQLKTPLMIIIWAVVFVLNIVAVVFVQNNLIYNITDFSKEALQEHSYFENCEIISVEPYEDYYVVYQNADGEKRVSRLKTFPVKVFQRAKLDKSYDRPVMEDDSFEVVNDTMRSALWTGNAIAKLAGIYVVLGAVMLLVEFYLYGVFYRLFRE